MRITKSAFSPIWGVLLLQTLLPLPCSAHYFPMHEPMSSSAALGSSELNSFLAGCFGTGDAPFTNRPNLTWTEFPGTLSPVACIMAGSSSEDSPFWRCSNHFYDPTKSPPRGLADGSVFWGVPSFTWATAVNGGGPGGMLNNGDTWPVARAFHLVAVGVRP